MYDSNFLHVKLPFYWRSVGPEKNWFVGDSSRSEKINTNKYINQVSQAYVSLIWLFMEKLRILVRVLV